MTTNDSRSLGPDQRGLLADLLERYGEIMDGAALGALFRFPSDRAFRRATAKGAAPGSDFSNSGPSGDLCQDTRCRRMADGRYAGIDITHNIARGGVAM